MPGGATRCTLMVPQMARRGGDTSRRQRLIRLACGWHPWCTALDSTCLSQLLPTCAAVPLATLFSRMKTSCGGSCGLGYSARTAVALMFSCTWVHRCGLCCFVRAHLRGFRPLLLIVMLHTG
jgi:hypothetical protein